MLLGPELRALGGDVSESIDLDVSKMVVWNVGGSGSRCKTWGADRQHLLTPILMQQCIAQSSFRCQKVAIHAVWISMIDVVSGQASKLYQAILVSLGLFCGIKGGRVVGYFSGKCE